MPASLLASTPAPASSLVSILVPMPVLEPGQGWPGASVYAGQGWLGASVNAGQAPTPGSVLGRVKRYRQRWSRGGVGIGAGLAPGMMAVAVMAVAAVMPAPSPRHLS